MKVFLVAGARPNFMKIAPIQKMMRKYPELQPIIVHTGQHYDYEMSKIFFENLELPEPNVYLGVGPGTHAEQTGKIMIRFERAIFRYRPDLVIVVGDVNSTLACALVAAKVQVPIAHVEAGLRSFDRSMPEEINRILTDHLCDILFTSCEDANENLRREGISEDKIYFVGNVMIDSLFQNINKANQSDILIKLNLTSPKPATKVNPQDNIGPIDPYAVLTLHRPENVDIKETLQRILNAISEIQKQIKIIFPAHPRTRRRIKEFNLSLDRLNNLLLIDPLGYLDFLKLISEAKFVLTDSGGVQEETTVLGIPCLTLRNNTERPITVKEGTNIVVGTDPERIVSESFKILNGDIKKAKIPKFWDGKTASRIVNIIYNYLKRNRIK